MSEGTPDLAVVGGGPGGYVCAIRAAQLGMSVTLIESRATLGGTCLNVGCIPSKALLHASHAYAESRGHFTEMGIGSGRVRLHLGKMHEYRAAQIAALTGGVDQLMRKNRITRVHGRARLLGPGQLAITPPEGAVMELSAQAIVLATGSAPNSLDGVAIDGKKIVDSTGALELPSVPNTLAVIGGGIIGLELGSVWSRLGAEVTVIEYLDEIMPGADREIARSFRRELSRQGLRFELGAAVTGATGRRGGVNVRYVRHGEESEQVHSANVVLVATGRRPCTAGLGAREAGLALDAQGRIVIDDRWRTGLDNVYAIGDAVAGPMLAHKAEDEGCAVAEILAGQHGHTSVNLVPSVVYTDPEIAWVGATQEKLEESGRAFRTGKFSFAANARARSLGARAGFVKILADEATDAILGVHIMGPQAGEMIHEACVAMEFGASAEDLARTCHAHPTLSETVREAALAVGDGAIHA